MSRMNVNLAGVELKNPVMTASGTFGSGAEYSEFVDLNRLGAVVTKGVANVPWPGNPTPRVTETASGMLNAIGLQNPGIDVFCERDIPFLRKYDTKIIVNVCGKSAKDYCEVVERLGNEPVDMLEINVSCPNVREGGIAFGQNPKALEEITKEVKKYAKQPVIMKLSPNVTDITEMAKAAEAGGADVLSLINTLTGMKIDINRRTFALANKTGGMSGPAVKPVAVRMVYQVANAVSLPIIGMGGIATAEDALEFIMAGATAVSVGTANFFNPYATVEIADGIRAFLEKQKVEDINELIGDAAGTVNGIIDTVCGLLGITNEEIGIATDATVTLGNFLTYISKFTVNAYFGFGANADKAQEATNATANPFGNLAFGERVKAAREATDAINILNFEGQVKIETLDETNNVKHTYLLDIAMDAYPFVLLIVYAGG